MNLDIGVLFLSHAIFLILNIKLELANLFTFGIPVADEMNTDLAAE